MSSVPVSITAPHFTSDPRPLMEAARRTEDLGFAGIFVFDHLVPIGDPHRPVLEMAATLGAIAATTRTCVGTMVMRAPMRGPRVSAAIARTAAMVAPGRAIVGLGTGDSLSAEETLRYGQHHGSVTERVQVLRETLDLVRDVAVRRWVGGLHPRILELTIEFADGWNAWGVDPSRMASLTSEIRGRRPDLTITWGGPVVLAADEGDLEVLAGERGGALGAVAGTPGDVARLLRSIVEAGADELIVSVLPNRPERWELFAELVLPVL